MDGGHKSVAVGLCGYKSLRAHHNPKVMRDCHSYMDPKIERARRQRRAHGPRHEQEAQRLHHRDDDQQPHVRSRRSSSCTRTRTTSRGTEKSGAQGARLHAVEAAAARAPGDLPAGAVALRRDRRVRGRDRGRARAHARALLRAVPRAGQGAGRHPRHRHSVHLPVQRELVPEPAARAGDGARATCSTSTGARRS